MTATLTEEQRKKRLKVVDAEIESVEASLLALMEEDRSDYAQKIMDKLFAEFKRGKQWIDNMGKLAETEYYVYSPNGRRRLLLAGLTGDQGIIAKQVRRGTNAPIQGFASEVGTKASRRILETYYDEIKVIAKMMKIKYKPSLVRVFINRVVHDASYFCVPYAFVIPFIHILQWEATYGITKAYKDEFNIDFTIEPEIEIEIAVRDDHSHKWDWSLPALVQIVEASLADLESIGQSVDKEEVLSEIFKPWRMPEVRKYLQEKFPLLNVRDLDAEIKAAAAVTRA